MDPTLATVLVIGAVVVVAVVVALVLRHRRTDRPRPAPREDYSAGDPMAWDTHRSPDEDRPVSAPEPRRVPRTVPPLRSRPIVRDRSRTQPGAYDPAADPANPASPLYPGHYSTTGYGGGVDTPSRKDDTAPDTGSGSASWGGYSGGGYSSGHSSSDSGSSGSSGGGYSGGSSDSGSSGGSSGGDSGGSYSG